MLDILLGYLVLLRKRGRHGPIYLPKMLQYPRAPVGCHESRLLLFGTSSHGRRHLLSKLACVRNIPAVHELAP